MSLDQPLLPTTRQSDERSVRGVLNPTLSKASLNSQESAGVQIGLIAHDPSKQPAESGNGWLGLEKSQSTDSELSGSFSKKPNVRNPYVTLTLVFAYFVIQCSTPIVTTQSKHGNKSYPYRSSHVIVIAYLSDFVFCTCWHINKFRRASLHQLSLRAAVEYLPISIFDAGIELFRLKALEQLLPATYVILANSRLICTSLLNRVLLKRKLISYHWAALIFLICGILTANTKNLSNFSTSNKDDTGNFPLGLLYVALYAVCGGLSDAYSDLVLKKHKHMRMLTQYAHIGLFGAVLLFITSSSLEPDSFQESYFNNWDYLTFFAMMCIASNALVSGALIKRLDSMVKVLIQVMATIVVVLISIFALNEKDHFSMELFLGATVVITSVLQFKVLKGQTLY